MMQFVPLILMVAMAIVAVVALFNVRSVRRSSYQQGRDSVRRHKPDPLPIDIGQTNGGTWFATIRSQSLEDAATIFRSVRFRFKHPLEAMRFFEENLRNRGFETTFRILPNESQYRTLLERR